MGAINVAMNVVTLGGHSRLNGAKEKYEKTYNLYKSTHAKAASLHASLEQEVELLGCITANSFVLIRKACLLVKTGRPESISLSSNQPSTTSFYGDTPITAAVLSQFSSAFTVTKGLGAGSAAAVGSWALVSLVGTASTGASIAGLSGAAATNATLAWFGGGALAAGGAGMAGGAMVLGGLVAAPLVIFSAWSSYSKAADVHQKIKDLEKAENDLELKIQELSNVLAVVKTQRAQLTEAYDIVELEYKQAHKLLFRYGVLSKIWHHITHFFGRPFYSPENSFELKKVTVALEHFSARFAMPQP